MAISGVPETSLTPCLLALIAAGCMGESTARVVVADSAGVRIVRSTEAAWRQGAGWRIAETPTLTIGDVDGDEAYLFHGVAGATRLHDGSVVVADGGSRTIRLYNERGEFVRSAGNLGDGPGEFRDLQGIIRHGPDSIVAFDRALQRLTVLGSTLEVSRIAQLGAPSGFGHLSLRHVLADGSLVARTNRGNVDRTGPGLWRDTLFVLTTDGEGGEPRVRIRSPGDDRFTLVSDGVQLNNNHPFGRRPEISGSLDRIYIAEGSELAVRIHMPGGELAEVWSAAGPARRIDQAITDSMKASWMSWDNSEEWAREVERLFREMALPDNVPATDRIVVDPAGCAWLRPFAVEASTISEWHVFCPGNEGYLGTIHVPHGLVVLEAGEDYVLGIRSGPSGAERVELYALVRS